MYISIADMEAAVQQREWERALIERKNRMLRAAQLPPLPVPWAARVFDFGRRSRKSDSALFDESESRAA
jgi:hypothetical protein